MNKIKIEMISHDRRWKDANQKTKAKKLIRIAGVGLTEGLVEEHLNKDGKS